MAEVSTVAAYVPPLVLADSDASQPLGGLSSGIGIEGEQGDTIPNQRIGGAEYDMEVAGGPPPPPPVVYALTAVATGLSVVFTIAPVGAGTLDYGDGSTPVAMSTATNTYVYAAAGTFTATFTPTNTNDPAVTASVTVTAPAV
jgi:hypothetical protein